MSEKLQILLCNMYWEFSEEAKRAKLETENLEVVAAEAGLKFKQNPVLGTFTMEELPKSGLIQIT